MPMPDHLQHLPYDELQVTLVDCPGHASLIKTIIGGAQIINMMLLVVDITRGIQTQVLCLLAEHTLPSCWEGCCSYNNNDNLLAFQLIFSARYLLGVPKP